MGPVEADSLDWRLFVACRGMDKDGLHGSVVARRLLWYYCCPRGNKAMGFGRVDAHTLRPRPPWW
jgi:hypothetical protein